jgi:hypothetical protein
MTAREYARKYDVSVRVVKVAGVEHLNAMPEDAAALLLGMSKHPQLTRKQMRAAWARILEADQTRRATARKAEIEARRINREVEKFLRQRLRKEWHEHVKSELAQPKAVVASKSVQRVERMMELATHRRIA